jgi:hypothetical protein
MQSFQVNKSQLSEFQIVEEPLPALLPGEVLLRIESYAFSANNITYAHLGADFRYWEFFPAANPLFGIIPVWGFAVVTDSQKSEIASGERVYGYFPMASHVKLKPGTVRETGFTDASEHRSKLPGAYRQYTFLKNDPMHIESLAAQELVFRPLYTTSYLLDNYLQEKQFMKAEQILITSASSKTAIALAVLLRQRISRERLSLKVLALTSPANLAFVQALGVYSGALSYNDLERAGGASTHVVDFTGNQELLGRIKNSTVWNGATLVGMVQHDASAKETPALGDVFFAPAEIKRQAKLWGLDGFQERLAASWKEFLPSTEAWLSIQKIATPEETASMYLKHLNGSVPPNLGSVITQPL